MRTQDLDGLDRATLRAWRAGNLLGWWLIGLVVYDAIGIVVAGAVTRRIGFEYRGWAALAAYVLTASFAAGTAGWIVGSRVYRSPGLVGALSVAAPGVALLLRLAAGLSFHRLYEIALLVVYAGGPAVVAGLTARWRWRRRPRALRSGSTR
jgi:hypothetical protein